VHIGKCEQVINSLTCYELLACRYIKEALSKRPDLRIDSMVQWFVGKIQTSYDKGHRSRQVMDNDKCITYAITYNQQFAGRPRKVQEHLQERLDKALNMKEDCVRVLPAHEKVYNVAGDTGIYKVDMAMGTCNCIDFCQQRSVCKHMFRVLQNMGLTIEALPRKHLDSAWLTVDTECIPRKPTVTHTHTAREEVRLQMKVFIGIIYPWHEELEIQN
jgi:hypothetical protein